MNLLLILAIIIALLLIILIPILYNGLKVYLLIQKKEAELKYKLVLSILKIPIFKRMSKDKDSEEEDEEEEEPDGEEEEEDDDEDEDKGLKEKYDEFKPILKDLKKSKKHLKPSIKRILKSIDIKKINGNLKIGLNDHSTTVKIASIIWSVGAIVNTLSSPTSLTVEPSFTEEIIDVDIELELKINLLMILIQGMVLISKKEIRQLIRTILDYMSDDESEEDE